MYYRTKAEADARAALMSMNTEVARIVSQRCGEGPSYEFPPEAAGKYVIFILEGNKPVSSEPLPYEPWDPEEYPY